MSPIAKLFPDINDTVHEYNEEVLRKMYDEELKKPGIKQVKKKIQIDSPTFKGPCTGPNYFERMPT